MTEPVFLECADCSMNAGSPPLCASCLHNREMISCLARERDAMKEHIDAMKEHIDVLGDKLNAWRNLANAAMKLLAGLS